MGNKKPYIKEIQTTDNTMAQTKKDHKDKRTNNILHNITQKTKDRTHEPH